MRHIDKTRVINKLKMAKCYPDTLAYFEQSPDDIETTYKNASMFHAGYFVIAFGLYKEMRQLQLPNTKWEKLSWGVVSSAISETRLPTNDELDKWMNWDKAIIE